MKKATGIHFLRTIAIFVLCLLLVSLAGCAAEPQDGVFLLWPEDNPYTPVAQSILPNEEIQPLLDGIFWYLEAGAVTEGYEPHAHSALKAGVAAYWYPQYLATAVIAVDRDQTAAVINSWRDLLDAGEIVSLFESKADIGAEMLLSAMAYGLEGEGYTTKTALSLLEKLNGAGQLKKNALDSPVLICFDDQAAQMIREGRNLEVIVPAEGTFAYQKGLLSTEALTFTGDAEQTMIDAGLRLLDGRCDEALYPYAAAYTPASEITDMDHYLIVELEAVRTLRREVWHTRLYTGADGREHQFLALLYIAGMLIWTASVVRRSVQKSVRWGALAACGIMLCWITVRMVKYQTNSFIYWDRFLWFSFLGFHLLMMFTLLAMAWNVDGKPGRKRLPKWLIALGVLNLLLALIALTNDLHSWVYIIDYNDPFWRDDYGYAAGYHLITWLCIAEFIIANIVLLMKSIRNPNKKGLIFPLSLCVLILVYRWGYISRIPLMRESDLTMMTGIFVLLFFESAIQAGMIPVNTKYTTVFSHSTLRMQILGPDGAMALAPISAPTLDQREYNHVLSGAPQPLLQDEDTLLYGGAITGGHVAWQEDISGLNRLHRETEESVRRLEAANALLAEEESIKRQLDEEAAKRQLTEQLEREIADKTAQLTQMIRTLDTAENQPQIAARVALLLCYIKRRSNLFFRRLETERLPADELTVYIEELAELAGHADVKIATLSQLSGVLPVGQATLFYDFFYELVAWAAEHDCRTMLAHLGTKRGAVMMRLTLSANICDSFHGRQLQASIALAGGAVVIKDLDDATGISLSFPIGGGVDA